MTNEIFNDRLKELSAMAENEQTDALFNNLV